MRIELLGTSFQIQTDESPERMQRIIDLFREKVDEVAGGVSTRDPLKRAILAGLLVSDEVVRFREEGFSTQHGQEDHSERIATRLIAELDEVLAGDDSNDAESKDRNIIDRDASEDV